MARDFATRTIQISEQTTYIVNNELDDYTLNNEWKSRNHAYLFFNTDGESFNFFGFYVNYRTGQIIDQITKQPVENLFMNKPLMFTLSNENYGVNLKENFNQLPRLVFFLV